MIRGLHNRREAGRSVEYARPRPARADVVCPGCGGPVRDAGRGEWPRWRCLRGTCPFVYGWQLEFARDDDEAQDAPSQVAGRPMIAIPFGYDGAPRAAKAVTWPRSRL